MPSIFSFKKNAGKKKEDSFNRFEWFTKRQASSLDVDDEITLEILESTQLEDLSKEDKITNTDCILLTENFVQTDIPIWTKESLTDMYKDIRHNESLLNFYTGLPYTCLFNYVLVIVKQRKPYKCKILTQENHLLLVLMKLKLGLLHTDFAHRFSLSLSNVSHIYKSWITILSEELEIFLVWPEREALRRNLPESFRNFKNCVSIIDCFEVFIERSFSLTAWTQTCSKWKHHHTIKYLIGITPAGAVNFLSQGWGGRVSDKELTIRSKFFDKLQHHDTVLADRGFTIEEEWATYGATLKIPHFTGEKVQMSAKEIEKSRKISIVRIHVERVIGRMKDFRIMQSIIPITEVSLLDNVIIVIAALVNLNNSVVSN